MTYVTKQEYLDFSGIDLDIELKKGNYDNPSKAVEIFIKRIQDWCRDYLVFNYMIKEEDFDVDAFKKGVLHQIDYIRRNGELTIENAEKIRVLSPNSFMAFKMGGMCNTTLPKPPYVDVWR